ncbi:MAG: acyl-CoA thioesterase [Cyanobacteria bacterium PR.3.49]|nr:acyl-CoA thioesterase [Cyanobacteria bacterium PR.3.49]
MAGNDKPRKEASAEPRDPAIRVILLPRDTNKHGTIFGGVILSYIDLAGAAAVSQVTSQRIVTVAIKEVVFHAPVLVGEAVSFYTEVTRIGNTSVTVHVDVESKRQGKRVAVTEADITFCCVDMDGKPVPVERN